VTSLAGPLDRVLDDELPRYAEAQAARPVIYLTLPELLHVAGRVAGPEVAVRVAVGAHTRNPRSTDVLPMTGHNVMMPFAAAVPVACPIASPASSTRTR
jgi:hypothetical protein